MLVNVTDLSSYEYCKRRLFLTNVLGLREPLKPVMLLGTVRHAARDNSAQLEESMVKSINAKTDISALFREHYQFSLQNAINNKKKELTAFGLDETKVFESAWPLLEEEAVLRADTIATFVNKNKIFEDELWQALSPKLLSELRIASEKLKLKGIIDRIEVYGDEYVPFELKTGNAPNNGLWPGHRIQLSAYMMLIENELKKKVSSGFVYYLDLKEKRRLAANPFLEVEVKDKVSQVLDLLNSKETPALCGNTNKCASCGIRESCQNERFIKELIGQIH